MVTARSKGGIFSTLCFNTLKSRNETYPFCVMVNYLESPGAREKKKWSGQDIWLKKTNLACGDCRMGELGPIFLLPIILLRELILRNALLFDFRRRKIKIKLGLKASNSIWREFSAGCGVFGAVLLLFERKIRFRFHFLRKVWRLCS